MTRALVLIVVGLNLAVAGLVVTLIAAADDPSPPTAVHHDDTELIPPMSAVREPSTTTSTTTPPTTTAPRVAAQSAAPRLRSTSYCLTGGMASGRRTYVGAVAANRYRLGTRLTAWPNPWGDPGMVFTVEDRHKPGATQLDFAMPGECSRALAWGNRRHVVVHVLG